MAQIWGIWGSYYNIPKAMFYLLKADYKSKLLEVELVDVEDDVVVLVLPVEVEVCVEVVLPGAKT